ncbi:MAG TPA: VOC family protein [Candidatus Binataceae bacterium]|jgi:catechol 2,3-dioxygenase-like lactoylglutathione lyase family enzyme|nr:VOC family protein [Candidatus Binataceae bacterium]
MPISEIHHTAINVSDIERSAAFYSEALGFRKVLDMKADQPVNARLLRLPLKGLKIRSIMMVQGSSTVGEIELMQVEPRRDKPTPPKRPDDLGIWLVSFEVKGEPLASVVQRLRAMGVKFYSDIEEIDLEGYAPMKAVIFEDPDGNLLELVQLPTREEYQRIKKERDAQRPAK